MRTRFELKQWIYLWLKSRQGRLHLSCNLSGTWDKQRPNSRKEWNPKLISLLRTRVNSSQFIPCRPFSLSILVALFNLDRRIFFLPKTTITVLTCGGRGRWVPSPSRGLLLVGAICSSGLAGKVCHIVAVVCRVAVAHTPPHAGARAIVREGSSAALAIASASVCPESKLCSRLLTRLHAPVFSIWLNSPQLVSAVRASIKPQRATCWRRIGASQVRCQWASLYDPSCHQSLSSPPRRIIPQDYVPFDALLALVYKQVHTLPLGCLRFTYA